MIQVSPASAGTGANPAHAAARSTTLATGGPPKFARALTALLVPGAVAKEAGEGEEGQSVAATGKKLPEGLLDGEAKPDEDAKEGDGSDLPFAWFAIPVAPVQATPLGIQLPRPAVSIPASEDGASVEVPELRFPGAALAEAGFGTEAAAKPKGNDFAVKAAGIQAALQTPMTDVSAKIELPVRATTAPIELQALVQQIVQPRAENAPQLAASLIAGHIELPVQSRRASSRDLAATASIAATALTNEAQPSNTVIATQDAQQGALDMRHQQWTTAMIDRIEALRDSSGSRETNIRLSPDQLGTVDVSIRHEGGRMHVSIQADTAAARAMLAEAQPRLAELADARGIRLGQTMIGGGDTAPGQQSQRQDAPRAPVSAAPASARADTETTGDERIA